jgi:DNA segregation ATPase FtsK/SpoIIIE-like protein
VKYSKITNLADDLCLAMQAESILIDRIPGKSTVGIQIPNRNRESISLRELLESDTYRRSASSSRSRSARRSTASPRRRPGDDAASADRRFDRRGQVRWHQRHVDEHPLPRLTGRCPDDHDRPQAP